jgi:hypothetical protein
VPKYNTRLWLILPLSGRGYNISPDRLKQRHQQYQPKYQLTTRDQLYESQNQTLLVDNNLATYVFRLRKCHVNIRSTTLYLISLLRFRKSESLDVSNVGYVW